jgi:hypothetical protein
VWYVIRRPIGRSACIHFGAVSHQDIVALFNGLVGKPCEYYSQIDLNVSSAGEVRKFDYQFHEGAGSYLGLAFNTSDAAKYVPIRNPSALSWPVS